MSDASLVRTAAELLAEGPAHTLDIARDVLGLSGHAGAQSAAVFHLLGADPRFQVDGEGVWSLDPSRVPLGARLEAVPFAVVDVETTGGAHWRGHRVVDISIVEVVGGRIVDEYQTLINPGRAVPPSITALTGITTEMILRAPYFEHVAEQIVSRMGGRVFVAHNASFDWGFVAAELMRANVDTPDVPRVCTVRMCRRLVPALRRRNLDVVCRHFGVDIHARHRAHGDALATARVLLRLLDEAAGRGIDDVATLQWYLKRRRRRKQLDPTQYSLGLESPRASERTSGL